jgi:purine-binding chemotaxis protein CheW
VRSVSAIGDGARQLCTFRVGDLFFGIDVTRVQEVLRQQEMTPVPLASPVICGLINLRGQIVTAIDMRRLLGLAPRTEALSMNVVVRQGDIGISLVVDEIEDVVDVDATVFEPAPVTLSARSRELILGVYKLKEQLLLLLDTDLATRGSEVLAAEGSEHGER